MVDFSGGGERTFQYNRMRDAAGWIGSGDRDLEKSVKMAWYQAL
jgi:hypothetical protein